MYQELSVYQARPVSIHPAFMERECPQPLGLGGGACGPSDFLLTPDGANKKGRHRQDVGSNPEELPGGGGMGQGAWLDYERLRGKAGTPQKSYRLPRADSESRS